MVAYSEIRPELKTGDIILTSGKSLFSWAIRRISHSHWSHVGMVVKTEEWDFVLLWESTTPSGVKDIKAKKVKRGVQLVPLSERVRTYSGDFAVRQLNRALTDDETARLKAFRSKVRGRDFDFDALELLGSAIDIPFILENKEDLSNFFCSELLAETYQELGFVSEGKPSNEYVPKDFSAQGELALLNGMSLGDEISISWEK